MIKIAHSSSWKMMDGKKMEPLEELTIDLPESVSGKAIEMVTQRKGEMISMEPKGDRMNCSFLIPSRGSHSANA